MSLSLHRQQLYWHNTCWMTMQIWRFTIIIFKTIHSTYIKSYSANIKHRGQTMTQCSILIYPLHPAQPTNEASSWLILLNPMISTQSCSVNKWGQSMTHIAESSDIHSILLSQWGQSMTQCPALWYIHQFCSANKWCQYVHYSIPSGALFIQSSSANKWQGQSTKMTQSHV